MSTRCYLVDIDGTLADATHRLHHLRDSPKDWRAFFSAVGDDAPIPHIIELVQDLNAGGATIVYVSGRSDECKDATLEWLYRHKLPTPAHLYMRKAGDYRDDSIVKIEILEQLRQDGYEPIMGFDDRDRVVKAFRNAGLPVAQVAEGSF